MDYTKLDVWLESRKLTNLLYNISKQFPKEEIYGLTNQMRRCAVSIPSNIAEGCGRQTAKDAEVFELIQACKRLLNGFINYYKKL